jgi:hypothetical protein
MSILLRHTCSVCIYLYMYECTVHCAVAGVPTFAGVPASASISEFMASLKFMASLPLQAFLLLVAFLLLLAFTTFSDRLRKFAVECVQGTNGCKYARKFDPSCIYLLYAFCTLRPFCCWHLIHLKLHSAADVPTVSVIGCAAIAGVPAILATTLLLATMLFWRHCCC